MDEEMGSALYQQPSADGAPTADAGQSQADKDADAEIVDEYLADPDGSPFRARNGSETSRT